MKKLALGLCLLTSCASIPVTPSPMPEEAAPATKEAGLEVVFPLKAGSTAQVEGLLVVPSRYIELLKAEAASKTPCPEPLVKATSAFWAGAAVGSVLGVLATGLVVYGAVEVVKAAK